MKLKIYTINKEYIDMLHEIDNRVLLEHPNGKTRKFIGVVITVNRKLYCIPFSSPDKADYMMKGNGKTIRKSFFPVILRLFDIENDQRQFYGKLLFNNMIPVNKNVIEIYDLENEEDYSYKVLVRNQYNIIRRLYYKGEIDKYCNKIYNEKINHVNKGYIFATVDFIKLEVACKNWAYRHLSITLKNEFKSKEIIYVNINVDFRDLVHISEYAREFKYEGFNAKNIELQNVILTVFNEFNDKKSLAVCVQVKEKERVGTILSIENIVK